MNSRNTHRHTEPTPTSLRREQAERLSKLQAPAPLSDGGPRSAPAPRPGLDKPPDTRRGRGPITEPTAEQIRAAAEKFPPLLTVEQVWARKHRRS